MKTLSKVRLSRNFFENSILVWNDKFRIDNFNRKIKIAKRDCDFSMPKKQAREQQLQLDSFRKKSLYGEKRYFTHFENGKKVFTTLENPYFFKWKKQEKNFIENNFSIARKKECQKLLWQIAFENRQKARQKKAFDKLFA